MTRPQNGPLSRLVNVERLPRDRSEVIVTATPEECAALAADFGIVAIRDLVGRFQLSGTLTRLHLSGTVTALVTQICTVSLDPFEAAISEAVDVDFSEVSVAEGAEAETVDAPDPIVNGRIDFGALTAEFLALGLDPFPRKPGAVFEPLKDDAAEHPFDALRKLREDDA